MNIFLPEKRYNFLIIPFLFFFFFSERSYALPPGLGGPGGGHGSPGHSVNEEPTRPSPRRVGDRLYFTPACPIVAQNFNNTLNAAADANGSTSDTSSVGWYLNASQVPSAVYFAVKSHRIKAQTLGGVGVWYSRVFNISGYTGIQVDAKISSEGPLTSSEYMSVSYILNGGPETLIEKVTGDFGADSTPVVTSAPMTGQTVQIVVRIYNTTVGNADYYIENYDVFKEVGPCTVSGGITVSASASNSGVLSCTNPSTTLTASTTATGTTTYSWTGPNSFTATGASVTTTTAGTYTVTGTNSAGTGTATVTVTSNTTAPASVTATASGSLSCTTTSVMLTGSTTTSGATFTWSGPSGFTATGATATATASGTYTLTATNPATGCTAIATTVVATDTARPGALAITSVPAAAVLTCNNTSVALTGSSSVSGASYNWSGPGGFTASSASASATTPGAYTLTVTNPGNGCTATTSSVVTQNTTAPGGVTTTAVPATAQITCDHPTVLLTGSSTTAGVTYSWSGPSVVSTTGAAATVNGPGTYTVTVTDPTNGCVTTLPGSVTKNVSVPVGLTASPSDIISCFTPVIDLQGGSTTPDATFAWSGPGGYTANTADAETEIPGSYTLVVTNPANGCTASTSTVVLADTATPANVTASNNGPLNCINTSVTITSSSSTSGVDFTWVTPGNTFISGATAVVTVAGTYTIQVTNDENGCVSQATTTVIQNTTGCSGSTAVTPGAISGRSMEDLSGDTATGFVYKAYPNPFSTTAFIEFTSPVSSPVSVEIYSTYGYREQLLFSSTVNANQAYKLQLTGLSSGMHFCVINNNSKIYTTKIVVIR